MRKGYLWSSQKKRIRIVERFLNEIFPAPVQKLHLSYIMDADDFYIVDYVQKDDKLGLSFSIGENRIVLDMTNELGNVKVVQPEELFSLQKRLSLGLLILQTWKNSNKH